MGLGDGLTNKLQLNYRVSCCDIHNRSRDSWGIEQFKLFGSSNDANFLSIFRSNGRKWHADAIVGLPEEKFQHKT